MSHNKNLNIGLWNGKKINEERKKHRRRLLLILLQRADNGQWLRLFLLHHICAILHFVASPHPNDSGAYRALRDSGTAEPSSAYQARGNHDRPRAYHVNLLEPK
jgi:hypothetical protein